MGLDLKGARVAIQGFGNVGAGAARFLHEAGARIVAVQDVTGAIHASGGLDPARLNAHIRAGGKLGEFPGAEALEMDAFWDVETDMLVPAALEGQIDAKVAMRINTKFVVEGANGPTTPAGDDVFKRRGIPVVPDVLANSGGVIVSYFEWAQNRAALAWTREEVNERLRRLILSAADATWQRAVAEGIPPRLAAHAIAVERVADATRLRGLYP